MECVTKQDGDIWWIDEKHPSYPRTNKPLSTPPKGMVSGPGPVPNAGPDIGEGPGTELKKLLKTIGITSTPTCSCNQRAKIMNEKGVEWCKDNIDTIVDWLRQESEKRNIPFFAFGAKKLVKFAIGRAEKVKT